MDFTLARTQRPATLIRHPLAPCSDAVRRATRSARMIYRMRLPLSSAAADQRAAHGGRTDLECEAHAPIFGHTAGF